MEAAATGQGAGVAARWPPLIVGLKIESVHELGCLSSAQAKRIVSKRDATDRAQRRLVLGFGVDRSWSGRGGQARTVNTERQAQWTRINYGPLARVAGKARRVPLEKRESRMEPCDARAVQRRTTSASENAGTTRQGQQGPERRSGRPAGHAAALQIDGSHRLQS